MTLIEISLFSTLMSHLRSVFFDLPSTHRRTLADQGQSRNLITRPLNLATTASQRQEEEEKSVKITIICLMALFRLRFDVYGIE